MNKHETVKHSPAFASEVFILATICALKLMEAACRARRRISGGLLALGQVKRSCIDWVHFSCQMLHKPY